MSTNGIASRQYVEPEALGPSMAFRNHDAQTGSERLASAIHHLFAGFAVQHRISADEARHLILNTGVRI